MDPIAKWLKDTRLRQTNPDTGRPWSQEFLVERIREETGWNLYRPNYVQYEAGNQHPTPETLQRFVDFWARRGEAGPDFTPAPEPMSFEDRQLALLERQTIALERQAAATEANTAMLERVLTALTQQPSPDRVRVLEAWTPDPASNPSAPQRSDPQTARE